MPVIPRWEDQVNIYPSSGDGGQEDMVVEKCQTLRKEKWIEARREDLLPIEYFHVVFTLPSELHPLVSMNRKAIYDLLFRSVSETLTKLANDPKHLGADIGSISIVHTWGQNLMHHSHNIKR
jgi:hypothetical protein